MTEMLANEYKQIKIKIMSNITVKSLLSQDNVKIKFEEILKERASSFTANLAVIVNNNNALQKCDPMTVVSSAIIAASLNLPLDPNLGFAAVVPYGDKAQFQIMYKGMVQLAWRSGQYQTIGASPIYEGQLISQNPLTSQYNFDFSVQSEKVIGYAAYFKLINGAEKVIYLTNEQIEKHGKKYSQTYKRGFGLWKEDFEAMAIKTVLKRLISKWGYLSIEMQKAIVFDQATPKMNPNFEDAEPEYIDAPEQIEVDPTLKMNTPNEKKD
jgi:recombination protein RecT